ncbi:hypothetical protein J3R83DRAFT_9718 [Lanmaoa asiatica]|nr:hypothetical protein J3R83DRAFT_9718 [Lanmaoa asiatica]
MSTAPTIHQNVVPSEVGWQFVPQYYTYVNKQPNRLHCFYTKTSTFIHGTEGEEVKPCFGQQEIHNKITSIGFQDCKVFIHSVDAQSSANGGIIIQVIGEMSNHGDPWRKFVQTFFLAEQPNGYFVLNDIFRFLKEDTVEDDVSEAEPVPTVSTSEPVPVEKLALEPVAEPEPSPFREPTPSPAPVPEEEPTTVQPDPPTPPPAPETKLAEPNGYHHEEPELEPTPAPIAPSEPEPEPEASPEPELAPASLPPASPAPSPTPPPAPVQQASAPTPAPTKSAPKSWASLAATDSKRWGSQVAMESKGLTEVPATSNGPVAPTSGTQSPAPHGPPHRSGQQHGSRDHPSVAAVLALTTPQCFVKGVVESVSQHQLSQTLNQRFGTVKDVEIVRSKACAFLEFLSLDAAKKAIITSLPQNQGGEGGVRIDVGGEAGQVRIFVETRKERSERPQSRPRGGPPLNGEARGGFRGGRGGPGRGRGGPPGGK